MSLLIGAFVGSELFDFTALGRNQEEIRVAVTVRILSAIADE